MTAEFDDSDVPAKVVASSCSAAKMEVGTQR